MKPQIKYIELKSGFSHSGPAWIGKVIFSKSGQTIYFNNCALKKLKNPGIGANHFDIETGEEYWVSGIKRNGQDRHNSGGGKILIDKEITEEYINLVDSEILDKNQFEIININQTINKSRFEELENNIGQLQEPKFYYEWYWDNNKRKLVKN